MKIGLLDYHRDTTLVAPAELMLLDAATKRGHSVDILYADHFMLCFNGVSKILYEGKKLKKYDVIIVRASFGSSHAAKATLIKQLQLHGYPVVNKYLGVSRAKNKIRMLQLLQHHDLPLPKTVVVRTNEFLEKAVEEIGSFPVIIKTSHGSLGQGVFIAESKRALKPITEHLLKLEDQPVTIQQYIGEAKGKDIRIFVLGNKVIAAMERVAQKGEFRSNFSIGGKVSLVTLSEKEKEISIKASQAFGLDYSGVDIMRTNEGPKILEINANPGLEGISLSTNVDVAEHIIKYSEKIAKKNIKLIKNDKE